MRTVRATRYVLALREGGSLPAIVEADDLGMYVTKFRGAGQGPLALVAELVAGQIGRLLGLRVPEIVLVETDSLLGRSDPDAEIRHLLKASVGLNLGLDYLPGSTMFDPAAGDTATAEMASMTVWFDAFVQNVDRTARNANLLMWHRQPYPIDHGAALFFHHNWSTAEDKIAAPLAGVGQHVLLPWASGIAEAGVEARQRITEGELVRILDQVPEAWIATSDCSVGSMRERYLRYLMLRLRASQSFEEEARVAHQSL